MSSFFGFLAVTPPVIPLADEDFPGEYEPAEPMSTTLNSQIAERESNRPINDPGRDFGRRRKRFKHD